MTDPGTLPRAPSGDILFTFAIVDGDGREYLLKTSGKDGDEAAQNAMEEAAEEADRMADLEPGDDEWDTALQCAMDDLQSVRGWHGHHDVVPTTEPVYVSP